MKFDSNLAWNQATASISANRAVIWPVAGAFFLLPALLSVWLFSDVQEAMLAGMGNPQAAETAMQQMTGKFALFGLIALITQSVGNLTLLALYADRSRPTVGEAIGLAFRAIPTLIGTLILLGFLAFGASLAWVLVILTASDTLNSGPLTFVLVLLGFALIFWALVRLSLIGPVVMIGREFNPIHAITRSWTLVRGNTRRLFGFYALLFIVYVIVASIVQIAILGLFGAGLAAGKVAAAGSGFLFGFGVVAGVIAVVVGVVMNAVLAAVHNQLAGDTGAAISETFA